MNPETRGHHPLAIPFAALLAVLLVAPAAAGEPKLSDDERARLEAGEVLTKVVDLDGGDVTAARAMGVIDAPPAAVWPHVDACGKYAEFMPSITESIEVARKGEDVTCRLTVGMPFPLSDLWSVTVAKHQKGKGERYRRAWKAIEGSYRVNEGSWVLSPWGDPAKGDRTLAVYSIKVAPKAAIPAGVRRAAQQKSLPEVISALRARVK